MHLTRQNLRPKCKQPSCGGRTLGATTFQLADEPALIVQCGTVQASFYLVPDGLLLLMYWVCIPTPGVLGAFIVVEHVQTAADNLCLKSRPGLSLGNFSARMTLGFTLTRVLCLIDSEVQNESIFAFDPRCAGPCQQMA